MWKCNILSSFRFRAGLGWWQENCHVPQAETMPLMISWSNLGGTCLMQDIFANCYHDIGSYWFPIFATNSMTLPSPIHFLRSYPICMVYFTKAGLPIYRLWVLYRIYRVYQPMHVLRKWLLKLKMLLPEFNSPDVLVSIIEKKGRLGTCGCFLVWEAKNIIKRWT